MDIQSLKTIGIYPTSILDIGCNIGQFFYEARRTWGNFREFLIDGNENVEPYIKNITPNYKISVLSDSEKEVAWYGTKDNPVCTGDSYYRELTQHYSDNKVIIKNKKTETLDQIFGPNEQFDLIKIDTQGSEIDIIKGGINICQRAKWMILEVSIKEYNDGEPTHDEVVNFMKNIGFEEVKVVEEHVINGELYQIDILFKNIML